MLRYRVTNPDGRRVEHVMPIGLVREFPKDKDAWREADRLGLSVRINDSPLPGRIRFDFLAEHYLRADFGADAVRPKSANTISHVEHIVRAYLVPRFGNEIAEDIKPLDIQRWFKSLHETGGLAWTTIAKMRGVMSRIYKVGILHEHVAKNPARHVDTRSKTAYKATADGGVDIQTTVPGFFALLPDTVPPSRPDGFAGRFVKGTLRLSWLPRTWTRTSSTLSSLTAIADATPGRVFSS